MFVDIRRGISPKSRERLFAGTLWCAIVLSALICVARISVFVREDRLVPPYKATLYWLNYDDGFVRRGLPGEMLSSLVGPEPSLADVILLGCLISGVGAASMVVLAWRLALLVRPSESLVMWVIVVASPLALPLMLRDLGRFDALIVASVVGIAVLPLATLPRAASAAVAALALAVSSAAEEFALLVALPVVVVVAYRVMYERRGFACVWAIGVIAPAVAVTVASFVIRPDRSFLAARVGVAHANGVIPPEIAGDDAASLLGASAADQVAAFSRYSPLLLGALGLGLAVLAAGTCWVVWGLVGRPSPRLFRMVGGWFVLCACALSAVGVDFLRWWALAAIGFLCTLLASGGGSPGCGPRTQLGQGWMVLAVVAISLLAQDLPIEPPRLL